MSDGNRASARDRWRYNLLRMRYLHSAKGEELQKLTSLMAAAKWQGIDFWAIWEEDFWTSQDLDDSEAQ